MMSLSKNSIRFNFDLMEWQGIDVERDIKVWERLYPDIKVISVVTVDMIQWLDKVKGTKKANKRNWRKFIVNWLKREQQRRVGL